MTDERCDVAVVGAGPAGLAAAERLAATGLKVIVIEREAAAGGIPRHCDHSPFGFREFRRPMRGAAYAARLAGRATAAGAVIRTRASVTALMPGGRLELSTPEGSLCLGARAVLLATGARETPRAARLIGGTRPPGVITTGALQNLVHLEKRVPFRRPVILGTELVSFSAVLTCRQADMAPVAMIEPGVRTTAWRLSVLLPMLLRIPVLMETELLSIHGERRVEGVTVAKGGRTRLLECDGVVVTGRFRPEASLVEASHLAVDARSGGPAIDCFGRCSDPAYFAAGNMLRAVETAGWCWQEGRDAAMSIQRALAGDLPAAERARPLAIGSDAIRFVVPQRVDVTDAGRGPIQLRVARAVSGVLVVRQDGHEVWRRRLRALPERRIAIPVGVLRGATGDGAITVDLKEDAAGG